MDFVDHSQETTELAKALVQVQKQMTPATKDARNPFIGNDYATLNSVMEACREALLTNNIWLCQYPVPVDTADCIGLMTKLTHTETGQWQASLAVVPLPKADPQGMGSAITYARRYAITAMLGMVTEDDDGEAAKAPVVNSRHSRKTGATSNYAAKKPKQSEFADKIPGSSDFVTNAEELELEGVTFQRVTAQDGRECIIATGNTQPNRVALSQTGFRWNPQRKIWWKYADAM